MTLVSGTKNAVIFGGLKSGACYFFVQTENIVGRASLSKCMQSAPPPLGIQAFDQVFKIRTRLFKPAASILGKRLILSAALIFVSEARFVYVHLFPVI